MKNKILFILLIIFQSSFAQNELLDKIKYANQNLINGLDQSDDSFKALIEYLEPINNSVLNKTIDSLDLESELIYYISRVTVSDYNIGIPKYFGFITNLKTDKVLCFKYIKDTWNSDYELTIYNMSPTDYNYKYYSFLIKNSDGNGEKIYEEIDKYRKEFTDVSSGGVSDYEFLYVLNSEKDIYKGYGFILSQLIFLHEEAEKLNKFDSN